MTTCGSYGASGDTPEPQVQQSVQQNLKIASPADPDDDDETRGASAEIASVKSAALLAAAVRIWDCGTGTYCEIRGYFRCSGSHPMLRIHLSCALRSRGPYTNCREFSNEMDFFVAVNKEYRFLRFRTKTPIPATSLICP